MCSNTYSAGLVAVDQTVLVMADIARLMVHQLLERRPAAARSVSHGCCVGGWLVSSDGGELVPRGVFGLSSVPMTKNTQRFKQAVPFIQ